jgi:SAM-dependent methyltransferase
MTSVGPRDTLAVHIYERALAGHRVSVRLDDGTHAPLAAQMWSRPRTGDDSVVGRCRESTLDVGCGPGRFTQALAAAGVRALGIDISPHAVRLARQRGVYAVLQDVFSRTPNLGQWDHVLLMDGNIGIGGDASVLLGRCRELLRHGGSIIVETGPPGTGSRRVVLQLVHADTSSRPFRWLLSDAAGIKSVAAEVGLIPTDEWAVAGRWFLELSAPGIPAPVRVVM